MQALNIANEALDSILGNLRTALRISIPVLLLVLIVSAILSFDFWQALMMGGEAGADSILRAPFGVIRIIFLPLLLIGIGMYWVTVAWHRFIILNEQPNGMLPKLHFGRIWAYFWRLIVLTFLCGVVVALPLAVLSSLMGGSGRINVSDYSEALAGGPVTVFFNFIGTTLFAYAFFRYSPFLVAAAVGQPMMASTGRESTYLARFDIFLLAVGYAVMSLVYTLVGGGMALGFWPIDLAIILVLQWITFMFTISLLTTLYQKSVAYYSSTGQADYLND